ncbi:MAG: hypothetical protein JSW03_00140 [Candidatus Eiseniibacteriota bacterium]|nr:MAG: hypothetical protein JSW03_00140 [Candidatus Eisenbacteria bacterium]
MREDESKRQRKGLSGYVRRERRSARVRMPSLLPRPCKTMLALAAVLSAAFWLAGAPACRAATSEEKGSELRLSVQFEGNSAVGSSTLRSLCALPLGSTEEQALSAVEQAVLQAYRDEGYLEASVESLSVRTRKKIRRLVVYIEEREPSRVNSFRFSGNRHLDSEELTAACGLRPGLVLSARLLDEALKKLVNCMADRGFPFAAARAGAFALEDGRLDFVFFIDEGPRCAVGEVVLGESNALTSTALHRALGVARGETYCESRLRRGINSLRRKALFAEVGEPVVSVSGGNTARVLVPVKDRKTTSVAGAVGFRGRSSELTGGLSLSLLNIARTGRSASASWEAAGGNVSSLSFSYAEPWVMGLPFSSAVSFEHVVRDTFFARTSVSLLCKVPLSPVLSAEAGASFEKTLETNGPVTRTSRVAWLGGLELATGEPHWSTGDSYLAALRGSRGSKRISRVSEGEEARDVFSTLQGRTLLQRRLGLSQIALVDVKLFAITEGRESASLDELFALGGKRTLRGYSERQFLAPTVGSVQLEYGILIGGEGGRAFALLDCGYASTQALSTGDRFHVGYGVGLRVPSPFGVAGVDFGVPAGESLSSGKVHVGLESTF